MALRGLTFTPLDRGMCARVVMEWGPRAGVTGIPAGPVVTAHRRWPTGRGGGGAIQSVAAAYGAPTGEGSPQHRGPKGLGNASRAPQGKGNLL